MLGPTEARSGTTAESIHCFEQSFANTLFWATHEFHLPAVYDWNGGNPDRRPFGSAA